MAEKNVAYTYSQLESQNDQIPAATEPTAIEWCMMRRAAKWVYFISLFQIIFGIFCIIGAGGFLIGLLSVIFGSFGLSGARKRNIRYLTAHFVFTLAMYILALVSIVLMIIYCDNCPFFIYIIAFLFQILLAVGMRHSRIFIALLKLYPQYQNTIATCHRNKNNTPVAVPMEVSTQTNIQSEQQIPMQFYPQMVAIPQQHVQGAAPLMTMAPIRYQQPFIQPMNGYPMYQQPNFPMGMQPYFAPFPVAPVQVQPPQDNNNSNSLYPNNNIPGVYRQV